MTMLASRSSWLVGCIADLPTPFNADGEVDLTAFARLCDRQITSGAPALVVCESAGEAATLSADEEELMIRTAVEVAGGRARVIAGAGSNATRHAVELTRRAEAAGADAVLSVVPYYNKPMQQGMLAHFQTIASSTCLPVILHDVPPRTLRPLADETLRRLADNRQFIGLRDASGDISRPLRLAGLLPAGFRLLSGDDIAFAYVAGGGDGCISELSNIVPDLCRKMFMECRKGRPQCAWHLQKGLIQLQACLSKESPAALKYALSLRGLMHPTTRLPLVELDDTAKAAVARALVEIDEHHLATVDG